MDTRTRVVRSEEDVGSWELVFRRPHPALRDHVLVLEGFEEQSRAPVRHHHLPPVFVPVIINLGSPYRLFDPADERPLARPRVGFVSGLGEAGGMTESDGAARCVQVNLTPLGARSILGVPMHELENQVVPLDDVLGPGVEQLEERLFEASDWETRLDARRGFPRSPAGGHARAQARCRQGAAAPRGDRRPDSRRGARRRAPLQPKASARPVPRARRAGPEDGRAAPPLQPPPPPRRERAGAGLGRPRPAAVATTTSPT